MFIYMQLQYSANHSSNQEQFTEEVLCKSIAIYIIKLFLINSIIYVAVMFLKSTETYIKHF